VLLLLCTVALLARWALGGQPWRDLPKAVLIGGLVLVPLELITMMPGIIQSADVGASLRFVPVRLGYALTFWMTALLVDSPRRLALCLRILVWTAGAVAIGMSLASLFPSLLAVLPLPPDLLHSAQLGGGSISLLGLGGKTVLLFNSFQTFASWAAFAFPVALSATVWPESFGTGRLRAGIALLAIAVGVLLSMTRAAWIGCALGAVLWLALAPWLSARAKWVPVLLGIGFVLAVSLYWQQLKLLSEWMVTAQQGSVDERLTVYRIVFDVFRTHPWFGLGPYVMDGVLDQQWLHPTVHNAVLVELAYVGLVGLLPILALWMLALWCGLRALRSVQDRDQRRVAAATLVSLVGGLAVFQTYSGVGEKSLYLMLGLAVSLSRLYRPPVGRVVTAETNDTS
jgi:O-antigen ligase